MQNTYMMVRFAKLLAMAAAIFFGLADMPQCLAEGTNDVASSTDQLHEHSLPAVGERIPSSGYDSAKPDCGMHAAKVFDAPISGLTRVGQLRIPHAREIPESSSASIGFEGLDRMLFDATPDVYARLGACGVKRARVQTMWSRFETEKGKFDFGELDAIVDSLLAQGIRPWFCVCFGNVLYMQGCYTKAAIGCMPFYYGDECRLAWFRYVRELARRYKGKVREWEIWNECNIAQFWQPRSPNAVDYIELVKLTGGIIRAEVPDAKIGGCTSCPGVGDWERAFFEAGGGKHIDFWCGHAYGLVPESYRGQQQVATLGEEPNFVHEMAWVRNFFDTHGAKHVELWQGESGFPSWFPKGHWLFPKGVCQEGWQSQSNQAKWLLRRWLTDRRAGIAVSSFYQASDIVRRYSMGVTTRPHPAEHGVLNGWTHEPKMSYFALGHYNAIFATATYDSTTAVRLSPEEDASVKTLAFAMRCNRGKGTAATYFVYYTPFDISQSYTGHVYAARTDAVLTVSRQCALRDPVLVDMLRGGVYAVSYRSDQDDTVVYFGLPLTDYPLVLTERTSIELKY